MIRFISKVKLGGEVIVRRCGWFEKYVSLRYSGGE